MLTLICYHPDKSELPEIIALAARVDLSIAAVVLESPDDAAASLAELAGLPLRTEFPVAALSLDPCVVIASDAALQTGLPASVSESRARLMSLAELQRYLEAPRETPNPKPETAAIPLTSAPKDPSRGIDQTLTRIENSLDREELLPWLLDLAIRSLDAGGGSLMLMDPYTDELYIAAAHGLSRETICGTRQGVGEGVAGRIAAGRKAELLLKTLPESLNRDRGRISAAICAPLIHLSDLLGVLNLVRSGDQPPFDHDDLQKAEALGERLARILHDADGVHQTRELRERRGINGELQSLSERMDDPEAELMGWATILCRRLQAEHVSLAFLRDDGSLLIGEGAIDGGSRTIYSDQQAPAWDTVLETGRSLIARQQGAAADDDPGEKTDMTIIFLPVGRNPQRGGVSFCFKSAEMGHDFQKRSATISALLEQRFADFKRRHRQRNRIAALKALTQRLGESDFGPALEGPSHLQGLARDLAVFTGAQTVLEIDHQGAAVLIHGRPSDSPPDAGAALDMLKAAQTERWHITSLMTKAAGQVPLSILALPLQGDETAAGLLLIAKSRLHSLGSVLFNDFNAGLALRLIAAWRTRRVSGSGAAVSVSEPAAAVEPGPTPPKMAITLGTQGELEQIVSHEISRSTRYHAAFSLSAFRFIHPIESRVLDAVRKRLNAALRESDRLLMIDGGFVVVIAPEEAHAVSHLEKRTLRIICEASGLNPEDLVVRRAVFPGRYDTPETMLTHVLGKA